MTSVSDNKKNLNQLLRLKNMLTLTQYGQNDKPSSSARVLLAEIRKNQNE